LIGGILPRSGFVEGLLNTAKGTPAPAVIRDGSYDRIQHGCASPEMAADTGEPEEVYGSSAADPDAQVER